MLANRIRKSMIQEWFQRLLFVFPSANYFLYQSWVFGNVILESPAKLNLIHKPDFWERPPRLLPSKMVWNKHKMTRITHLIEIHEKGKGFIHPVKAHWMQHCFHSIYFTKFFTKTFGYIFYLFLHSIIDRATETGQVDPARRQRLDSESENYKARKTISVPVEIKNVEWKSFDQELFRKLARQTSDEEFKIYRMLTLCITNISLTFLHKHYVNFYPIYLTD